MNGIEYIARILKQEGVEWISCFPSNPLIEEAAKESIRPIAFRHERGAVMAADGFSRTSNRQRFGVVAIQSQAGAKTQWVELLRLMPTTSQFWSFPAA